VQAPPLTSRLPNWAVIKDARRRQRRRIRRRAIVLALLAVVVVVVGGLLVERPNAGVQSKYATSIAHERATQIGGYIEEAQASSGHVWVLTCVSECAKANDGLDREQLVEVDAGTGTVVRRLPLVDAISFTTVGRSVWVAHFITGTITRVDPLSGRATAVAKLRLSHPVAHHDRRFLLNRLSSSGGYVWASTARGWIAQIDELTGSVVRMMRSPSEENSTTTDRYGSWVAEDLGGVGLLRPHTSSLRISPMMWRGAPLDITDVLSGGGVVWALAIRFVVDGPPSTIILITDPRTDRVIRRIQVPEVGDPVVSGGALYVGDLVHGRVYRVGPDGTTRAFRTRRHDAGLATSSPGFLWATTTNGALPHAWPGRLLRITLRRE
jgi:hypothetical protein